METDRKALLFYNEDWKKDTHRKEGREGGRISNRIATCAPSREHRRGRSHVLGIFPGG